MANKICAGCGAGVSDDKSFCTECGAPVSSEQPAAPPPVLRQTYQSRQQPDIKPTAADFIPSKGSRYEPISTLGYLGILLLMMIPLINLILLIVWARGSCRKIAKRSFARAVLISWLVTLILGGILAFALKSHLPPMLSSYSPPQSLGAATPAAVSESDAAKEPYNAGLRMQLDSALQIGSREAKAVKWPDALSRIPPVKGGVLTAVEAYPSSIDLYYVNLPIENLRAWKQELGAKGYDIKKDTVMTKNIQFNGKTYPEAEIWYEENGTNEWHIYFEFKK